MCSQCGESFVWISCFIHHLGNHSGRKCHVCQGCWKTHFNLAMAEHQKTHEKEQGYVSGRTLSPHPNTYRAYAWGRGAVGCRQ